MAKTFQELNLSNAFLFAAALEDPEICRLILEMILGIRFHQAEMDVMSLKPGEDFRDLRPGYVVFICAFDPFGLGLYRYTFENMCQERELLLGDGAKKIFLNTKGNNEAEVPKVLTEFLHYVEDTTDAYVNKVDNQAIRKIHERVVGIKKSREWEGRYMKFDELLQESAKKGEEKGQQKVIQLVNCMIQNGETDQISRLNQEPEFLQAMLEKYQLQ